MGTLTFFAALRAAAFFFWLAFLRSLRSCCRRKNSRSAKDPLQERALFALIELAQGQLIKRRKQENSLSVQFSQICNVTSHLVSLLLLLGSELGGLGHDGLGDVALGGGDEG